MNRNMTHGQGRFRCMTRIYAPEKCQCPSMKESVLEKAVLEAIQEQIQELVDAKAVIEAVRREGAQNRSSNEYLIAINRARREQKRLEDAKFRLYDNFEKGILNTEEYAKFKEKYNVEIAEQEEQIKQLQASMEKLKEVRKQDDEFVAYFEAYGNIEVIDRGVLERLLDHIEVIDSTHIHIYFKFSTEHKKILDFANNIREVATSGVC